MRYIIEVLFSIQFRLVCLAGIVVALILPHEGVGFSICTMERFWHVPCPGCGLTRGVSCFFQLHWGASLEYNISAPVVSLTMAFFGALVFAPRTPLARVRAWFFQHESLCLWSFVSLTALFLVTGLVRLVFVWMNWGSGSWLVGRF